jgi:hypothetical protein
VQSRNIFKASLNFVSHKNNRPNNKQQQFTYRGARQQTTNSRLLKTQKRKKKHRCESLTERSNRRRDSNEREMHTLKKKTQTARSDESQSVLLKE